MSVLILKLLGRIECQLPAGSHIALQTRKSELLLAYLALNPDIRHSRDKLMNLLWSDRSESQARNSLRQALSTIKKSLETVNPSPLMIDRISAGLDRGLVHIDVTEFEQCAACSNIEQLSRAAELYRGEFLEGITIRDTAVEEWLAHERDRLKRLIVEVLTKLSELQISGSDYKSAVESAERLVQIDPLYETGWRILMRAYHEQGDRNHALLAFKRCQDVLHEELGVTPELETRQLRDSLENGQVVSVKTISLTNRQNSSSEEIEAKNSILVLPFDNLSGDPGQEYFCDGLTEEIIYHLSRFRDLFVIAKSSSFFYKNKQVNPQEIARELDVRYIVEGSVQTAGNQLRIVAQLIEGDSGRHLWADRYDREQKDSFKLQDELTEMIVGSLTSAYGGRIHEAWLNRKMTLRPKNNQAIDFYIRGLRASEDFTKEAMQAGRELFKQAIDADPGHTKAYSKLAWTYILDAIQGWVPDFDGSMELGYQYAKKAIESDDSEAWAYWPLAAYYIYACEHDRGVETFQKAVRLNPNDAEILTDAGYYLSYAGQARAGLEYAEKGMRLNPHYPEYYLQQLVQILFDNRKYQQAVDTQKKIVDTQTTIEYLYLAACQAALGQTAEAGKAIQTAVELDPGATVEKWTKPNMAPYRNSEDLEHFRHHLRQAGLPEKSGVR